MNLVPGVVSMQDANGRRNEADIFVRGFGRQQVPLMVDGVRIYLPADNRLDFGRFLTADLAHQLLDLDVTYAAVGGLEVGVGFKNLLDDDYELAWCFPQPGRAFFVRTRVAF